MTQTSRCTVTVLFTCLLLHISLVAQIRSNYHFGFIGVTGDTSAKLSEPVIIQYSNCFEATNGVNRFTKPKSGVFSIVCYEAKPDIKLLVNAYPNPVINELKIRSLFNFPERGLVKYRVVLTDLMSNKLREINLTITNINEGFSIRVNDLPMGYFIVTLYSDKELIQSFKILKAA